MKRLLGLMFLLLAGCSHTMLSTSGQVYMRNIKGVPLICAVVNEWNIKELRSDGKEVGCWCRYPPGVVPNVGMLMTFQLSRDEFCQDGEVPPPPTTKRLNFEGEERL